MPTVIRMFNMIYIALNVSTMLYSEQAHIVSNDSVLFFISGIVYVDL